MTSLFINDRNPFPKDEILTQSFLIDKIASNMRMKYKKVFSVINYDENSLKTDIHHLLSKYISNKHKEINIRYIETTILNKIRDKYKYYKFKSPTQSKNKNLIKIVNSSPNKYQSYLDIVKHKTNSTEKNIKLPPIINNPMAKSTEINGPINNNKYYTLGQNNNNIDNNIKISNNNEEENIYNMSNENKVSNINNEINEINNKTNELQNDDGSIKKEIEKEQEELNVIEKTKEDIQKQIDEINKEIEREKLLYLKNENNKSYKNNKSKKYQLDEDIYNSYNTNINSYNAKLKNDSKLKYPSITLEQMQYLERKKRIQEDYENKQNRYIFVKPRHYKNEEEELNAIRNKSSDNCNSYRYDNVRINQYSMNKLSEFNKIKEKIQQEKELKYKNNKSTNNIMYDHDYDDDDEFRLPQIEKKIPYEDKIQMKILQRSMEQERAIEHLKKLIYPEKQLLAEREYQGFNKAIKERNMMKKREIELADRARKIQIEKMKKSLDFNIDNKKRRKNEERKIEQKYREMLDRDYEIFLEKERKEKNEKAQKKDIYRKMLDEQIEQKNQLMLEEDNLFEKNGDFDLIEN